MDIRYVCIYIYSGHLQGCLAHKKRPPPPRTTVGPQVRCNAQSEFSAALGRGEPSYLNPRPLNL